MIDRQDYDVIPCFRVFHHDRMPYHMLSCHASSHHCHVIWFLCHMSCQMIFMSCAMSYACHLISCHVWLHNLNVSERPWEFVSELFLFLSCLVDFQPETYFRILSHRQLENPYFWWWLCIMYAQRITGFPSIIDCMVARKCTSSCRSPWNFNGQWSELGFDNR